MNSAQYLTIKCYHITKVYQRDVPAMTKGCMHGFYQCEHHQLINYHQNLALYTYLQDFDRKLHAECNEYVKSCVLLNSYFASLNPSLCAMPVAKQPSSPTSFIPFPTPSSSAKKPSASATSVLLKGTPILAPALMACLQTPPNNQTSDVPETPTMS